MIRMTAVAMFGLMLGMASGAAQMPPPTDTEIRQNIGTRLPLDLSLRDEAGRERRLGALFGSRATILAPVYFRCPNLCGVELANLMAALGMADLAPGRDVEIIAVSMDPREGSSDAAARKAAMLNDANGAAAAGWHFLTGGAKTLTTLADVAGFTFRYDATSDQYEHATGIAIVTRDGIIARYLPGLEYPPATLRQGVAEAASGVRSEAAARVRLTCFGDNPLNGRYTPLMRALLPGTAAFSLIALGGVFLLARRRGRGG